MSKYRFQSKLGNVIQDFITMKNSLGFPYTSSERILKNFDKFVHKQYPDTATLTKDIATNWSQLRSDEHPNWLLRRITPIRQLGKFMTGHGYDAYIIPGHIPAKQIKYSPHIYTSSELTAFFKAINREKAWYASSYKHLIKPILFRLLFCCGLRSSEARLLAVEDVNLHTGKIHIRESKGWKARLIYMHTDLTTLCKEYDHKIEAFIPGRKPFFPNHGGSFYSGSTIDVWFHETWDNLLEAKCANGNPCRVHDFRHSYAVYRLNSWIHENKQIDSYYPYLSEYLGHRHFADTDYYLHLVSEFYPEMEKRMKSINESVIPEVPYEK